MDSIEKKIRSDMERLRAKIEPLISAWIRLRCMLQEATRDARSGEEPEAHDLRAVIDAREALAAPTQGGLDGAP